MSPLMRNESEHRQLPISDSLLHILSHFSSHPKPYTSTTTNNMSSPAPQYVYVPNLVGGQMLRLPVEDDSSESQNTISQQPIASPTLSSRYTRDPSPSPSVESVETEE
ncbi:malic acid transporter [Curvularia clavata]|uniref:Malic acid transporter n=1 Tax=Curvularia clavata TaxID=95742 RepID=A0A9Q9DUF1_CURCL|nr:malic acid transporter [Curvularia clavata]